MVRHIIIGFVILHTFAFAQVNPDLLIDSLTLVNNHSELARLGQKIALELSNSDWKRAITYLEYAEEEAKASDSEETLAMFYSAAASIYSEKDVLDVALDYYLKAYSFFSKIDDSQDRLILENDLAVVYARMKNREMALLYFKKCHNHLVLNEKKDSIYLAKILNNIATLYKEKNQDSSIAYYEKSLEIANELNDNQLFAYLYANLGRVYFLKNEQSKAQSFFEKSLAIANTNSDNGIKILVYQLASEYFLKSRQTDSAIYYAQIAVGLLNQDFYSFSNQDVIQTLYKAFLAKEDYKNAATYFGYYDQIRDSINVEEKAVNIERIKLKMEYETKEQIRKLEENKKRFGYIIIGLSLISGLLILLIILVRYKNRLSKVQLEKELSESKRIELKTNLELKNRTLIAKAMNEIQRTEIIQGILQDLREIKTKTIKKETQDAIDFISSRLQKEYNLNNWKEFEVSFEQVHEAFYKNLNEKHPDLTSNDRRLCALLKLNLNSKEISQITGQSFKSIENARTRLRKKLDLTNTKTDLVVYLNTFN